MTIARFPTHDGDTLPRVSVRREVDVPERSGQSPVHALTAARYIQQNVLAPCGQAVAYLHRAGLLDYPDGERRLDEWWLVTDDLSRRLERAGMSVLHFGELNMWGRSSFASGMREDLEVAGALRT